MSNYRAPRTCERKLGRRCGAKFVLVIADWHVKSGTVDGYVASSLPDNGEKKLWICAMKWRVRAVTKQTKIG